MLKLDYKKIIDVDMSFLLKNYDNIGHINTSQNKIFPTIEHYKLLTYISHQLNNVTIIDAGTHHGISAVCLAQNKNNKVISYDIVKIDRNNRLPNQHTPIGDMYPNITFIQSDINRVPNEEINNSSFLFLDIIHDGNAEKIFSEKIIEMGYRGYILCDDVGLSGELRYPLQEWFNSLPWDKYDLTEIGHFSGSGLLDCGSNGVEIIKNYGQK